jgi:LysR family hydrogen peroxide-inducible transcriptional activator
VLLIEDGHCLRGQAEEICANAKISNTYDVGAAGLATVCQMVAAGNGVTLLPECAVELEARIGTGIAIAQIADPQPFRTIGLAWSKSAVQKEKLLELSASIQQLIKPIRTTKTK